MKKIVLSEIAIGDIFPCVAELVYVDRDYVSNTIVTREEFENSACTVRCKVGYYGKVDYVDHDNTCFSLTIFDEDGEVYDNLEIDYDNDDTIQEEFFKYFGDEKAE